MDGPVKIKIMQAVIFVIETISQLKISQIQGSLQLARKVALDQVAYENEVRGIKSLKIQALCRCNEGTIVDGPVKNPYRTGCNVCNRNYQPVEISASSIRYTSPLHIGC